MEIENSYNSYLRDCHLTNNEWTIDEYVFMRLVAVSTLDDLIELVEAGADPLRNYECESEVHPINVMTVALYLSDDAVIYAFRQGATLPLPDELPILSYWESDYDEAMERLSRFL